MDHSKYFEYSLEELYQALDTVDEVEFPGQREAIEARIEELQGNVSETPNGIGGWLILVAIAVIVGPISFARNLFGEYDSLFQKGLLAELLDKNGPTYSPTLASWTLLEFVFILILTVGWACASYLFFSKNKIFPKVFIVLMILGAGFTFLDSFVLYKYSPDEEILTLKTLPQYTRSIIALVFWVPYMLISKRVSQTFIN